MVLHDVLRVDARFGLVARLPAHGPWEVLRIGPFRRTGRDEQLRHLLGVHVFLDRRISRRAQRVHDEQHFVILDQLARLLHRLRRAVAVVIGDEGDLAAVDAALLVDHLEIGSLGLADGRVGRSRAAIRHDVADLDLGIGGAGIVFLLRVACGGRQALRQRRRAKSLAELSSHAAWSSVLPMVRSTASARLRRLCDAARMRGVCTKP